MQIRLSYYCFIFFIMLAATLSQPLSAKVRILTFHYNKPNFVELQHRTLKKFLKNKYELIVFNDARNKEEELAIKKVCEKNGISCIRYEQQWHQLSPLNAEIFSYINMPSVHSHVSFTNDVKSIGDQASVRHCHVIQYALDNFGYNHKDIVVIMDGDFFLVRPLNLQKLMRKKEMIGAYRYFPNEDVGYMWVPFVAMNMPKMPDKKNLKFNVDLIKNKVHDTGAHSYHYLNAHPELNVKKYSWHGSTSERDKPLKTLLKLGFNEAEIELAKTLPWPACVEFHIDHNFLHFGASSFKLEGHDVKEEYVTKFLNKILK